MTDTTLTKKLKWMSPAMTQTHLCTSWSAALEGHNDDLLYSCHKYSRGSVTGSNPLAQIVGQGIIFKCGKFMKDRTSWRIFSGIKGDSRDRRSEHSARSWIGSLNRTFCVCCKEHWCHNWLSLNKVCRLDNITSTVLIFWLDDLWGYKKKIIVFRKYHSVA